MSEVKKLIKSELLILLNSHTVGMDKKKKHALLDRTVGNILIATAKDLEVKKDYFDESIISIEDRFGTIGNDIKTIKEDMKQFTDFFSMKAKG